jgi:hypothetical protein
VHLPEAAELLADEVDLLFEDPMPAFLDDTAIGRIGDRLCRVEAMISERSMASSSQHRHSQRVFGQLSSLRGHLRNVAVMVQARAEAAWLPHMHDVLLYLLSGTAVGL